MEFQRFPFLLGELEHVSLWESSDVALYGFVEVTSGHLMLRLGSAQVPHCKVSVEHNLYASDGIDEVLYLLLGYDLGWGYWNYTSTMLSTGFVCHICLIWFVQICGDPFTSTGLRVNSGLSIVLA